jgi:hypothetical protein
LEVIISLISPPSALLEAKSVWGFFGGGNERENFSI